MQSVLKGLLHEKGVGAAPTSARRTETVSVRTLCREVLTQKVAECSYLFGASEDQTVQV